MVIGWVVEAKRCIGLAFHQIALAQCRRRSGVDRRGGKQAHDSTYRLELVSFLLESTGQELCSSIFAT
eukprot:760600-Hanusia_phi.AAC.1